MNNLIKKYYKQNISAINNINNINLFNLEQLIRLITDLKSNIICTGVGKSSLSARQLSYSLCSIGIPVIYIHPTDALHGIKGFIKHEDLIIVFSNSGETEELVNLINKLKNRYVLITGNLKSELSKQAFLTIDYKINEEACPYNIVPTSSFLIQTLINNLICSILFELKSNKDIFLKNHPGGKIGKNYK